MKKITTFIIGVTLLISLFSFFTEVQAQNIGSLQSIVTPGFSFKKDLRLGDTDPDVRELQRVLNASIDTTVAIDGDGSRGHETTYFGNATKAAVIKFQTKYKDVVLTLNSITTADGIVNKATRTRLNLLIGVIDTYDSVGLPQSHGTSAFVTTTPTTYVAPTVITTNTQSSMSVCSFIELLINIGAIMPDKVNAARSVYAGMSCNTTNILAVNPNYPPSVVLKVNNQRGTVDVTPNTYVTISWTSTNVTSCASAGGSKPISGSQSLPVKTSGTVAITCSGPGGTVTDSVAIRVSTVGTTNTTNTSSLNASCNANPNSVYTGSAVSWSANAYGGNGSYSYSWSGTDSLSGSGQNVSKTYSSVGTKSATVTISSGGSTATASCNAVVNTSATNNINQNVSGTASLTIDGHSGQYNVTTTNNVSKSLGFSWMSTGFSLCKMISDLPVSGLNNVVSNVGFKQTTVKDSTIFSFLCENDAAGSSALVSDNTLSNYLIIDLMTTAGVTHADSIPDLLTNDAYKTTKLVLKKIPAGTFTMGSPENEPGRRSQSPRDSGETQHQVTITNDFYMGVFKVTQKQYELVMGNNPSQAGFIGDKKPVLTTSWDQIRGGVWPESVWPGNPSASSFAKKLSQKVGINFDLPTSAMWEYAARAGSTKGMSDGSDFASVDEASLEPQGTNRDLCVGGYSTITDVGTKNPNNWGLYDVHCNASEQVLDLTTSAFYPELSKSQINPVGLTINQANATYPGGVKVLRMTKNDISQGMGGMRLADNLLDIWAGNWNTSSDHPELHGPSFRIAAIGSGNMAMKNIDMAESTAVVSVTKIVTAVPVAPVAAAAPEAEEPGVELSFGGRVVFVSSCGAADNPNQYSQVVIESFDGLSSVVGKIDGPADAWPRNFGGDFGMSDPTVNLVLRHAPVTGAPLPKVGDCVIGTSNGEPDTCSTTTMSTASIPGLPAGTTLTTACDGVGGKFEAGGIITSLGVASAETCLAKGGTSGQRPGDVWYAAKLQELKNNPYAATNPYYISNLQKTRDAMNAASGQNTSTGSFGGSSLGGGNIFGTAMGAAGTIGKDTIIGAAIGGPMGAVIGFHVGVASVAIDVTGDVIQTAGDVVGDVAESATDFITNPLHLW